MLLSSLLLLGIKLPRVHALVESSSGFRRTAATADASTHLEESLALHRVRGMRRTGQRRKLRVGRR